MNRKILIIEDDITFANILINWFRRNHFTPILSTNVANSEKILKQEKIALVLSDYRLPDGNGLEILERIKKHPELSHIPFIIMTSYAETPKVVEAIKMGAFDYLEKPINPTVLAEKITQSLNHTRTTVNENISEKATCSSAVNKKTNYIFGTSQASKQLMQHIKLVAPTQLSVLIRGESGTGKEMVANTIHQQSSRKEKPFIALDCGSLSKELAPSELFGHLKGSFTSALENKKGAFEQASGGTLFLDEIGNLSYEVQIQLLRAVQERKIRPVGALADIQVDVRLIVATNENLESAISNGSFREDLYYRLNEFTLQVPPLRERAEDLEIFANYFLEEANLELNRHIKGFSKECMELMYQYPWSGNLRELRNTIRRMVLFCTDQDIITEKNLPHFFANSSEQENSTQPSLVPSSSLSLKDLDEKSKILQALQVSGGNKSKAAQLLQIDRKTLYNKLHLYGIKL